MRNKFLRPAADRLAKIKPLVLESYQVERASRILFQVSDVDDHAARAGCRQHGVCFQARDGTVAADLPVRVDPFQKTWLSELVRQQEAPGVRNDA
jgi:hypothetical protein